MGPPPASGPGGKTGFGAAPGTKGTAAKGAGTTTNDWSDWSSSGDWNDWSTTAGGGSSSSQGGDTSANDTSTDGISPRAAGAVGSGAGSAGGAAPLPSEGNASGWTINAPAGSGGGELSDPHGGDRGYGHEAVPSAAAAEPSSSSSSSSGDDGGGAGKSPGGGGSNRERSKSSAIQQHLADKNAKKARDGPSPAGGGHHGGHHANTLCPGGPDSPTSGRGSAASGSAPRPGSVSNQSGATHMNRVRRQTLMDLGGKEVVELQVTKDGKQIGKLKAKKLMPLDEQVAEFCEKHKIQNDDDQNYQLLLKMVPKSQQKWAVTEDDLLGMKDGEEVRMVSGCDFVLTVLDKVKDLVRKVKASRQGTAELISWMDCILRNCSLMGPIGEWFASEVVQQRGIQILFETFHELHRIGDKSLLSKTAGIVLSSLSVLMQFEAGISWTEDNFTFDVEIMESLIATMFGMIQVNKFLTAKAGDGAGAAKSGAGAGDGAGEGGGEGGGTGSQGLATIGAGISSDRRVNYNFSTMKLAASFLCTLCQQFVDAPGYIHQAMVRSGAATPVGVALKDRRDTMAKAQQDETYYHVLAGTDHEDPTYPIYMAVFLFLTEDTSMQSTVQRYLEREVPMSTSLRKKAGLNQNSKHNLVEDLLLSAWSSSAAENERFQVYLLFSS